MSDPSAAPSPTPDRFSPDPSLAAPDSARAAAARAASVAAQVTGIEVAMLEDAAAARRAATLFGEVWAVGTGSLPISGDLIRALVHAGNYGAGAWAGEELVGASVGFLALDRRQISLHSHITGMARTARGSNVGFALKQHQRAWALGCGIREVTWTFDPLVRANARFNLVKLGAVAVAYHADFYGEMEDGVNAGDPSDRCTVSWKLDSARASAASAGSRLTRPEVEINGSRDTVLLASDPDGGPAVGGDDHDWNHPGPRLCQVPPDIVSMRAEHPERARAWRYSLRDTMGAAMAAGFVTGTITRDGWYALTRDQDEGPGG